MTPYFASLSDFLAMNGYARFVWPAFAVVLGVLVFAALYGRYERRAVLADIRRQERRRQAQAQEDTPSAAQASSNSRSTS
ncbi:heme exporter protein CcmD [Carnimonas bestiolae]|uniref:heme exporter protein CcmD n=1 Tax=Carnimonas bestiolae TaxID=3402172 RepID=UPI003EDC7AAF